VPRFRASGSPVSRSSEVNSTAHHAPTASAPLYSLSRFPLYAAFRRSLVGRDSDEYYRDSVTLRLAPGGPSQVPFVRYVKPSVGVPYVALIEVIPQRPFPSKSISVIVNYRDRWWSRFKCAATGVPLHHWQLGFKQSAFTMLAGLAAPQATHFRLKPLSWHAIFPIVFPRQVGHVTSRISLQF
jgi:hypothetical protein